MSSMSRNKLLLSLMIIVFSFMVVIVIFSFPFVSFSVIPSSVSLLDVNWDVVDSGDGYDIVKLRPLKVASVIASNTGFSSSSASYDKTFFGCLVFVDSMGYSSPLVFVSSDQFVSSYNTPVVFDSVPARGSSSVDLFASFSFDVKEYPEGFLVKDNIRSFRLYKTAVIDDIGALFSGGLSSCDHLGDAVLIKEFVF
jgi:hypothetical protein